MISGLATVDRSSVVHDPSAETLREIALSSGQCRQTCDGALVILTGKHTGRAAADRYIVETPATAGSVAWGKVNQPLSLAHFRLLREHLQAHLSASHTFELSLHAGGSAGAPVQLSTTSAAHALF